MTTASSLNKKSNLLSPQLILHTKKVDEKKKKKEEEEVGQQQQDDVDDEDVHPNNSNHQDYVIIEDDKEERDCQNIMSSNTTSSGSSSIFDNFICHGGGSTTSAVLSDDDNDVWVALDNNNQTTDGPPTPTPATTATSNNNNNNNVVDGRDDDNNKLFVGDENNDDHAAIHTEAIGYASSTTTSASWSIGLVSPTNSMASTTLPPSPRIQQDMARSYDLRYNPKSFPNCGSYTTLTSSGMTSPTSPGGALTIARGATSQPVRCYRLNLERPLNIHGEQSPLEYGDYMSPWSMEVRPVTVGPVEYCPPRHLGGNVGIWQELLRWNNDSATTDTNRVETRKGKKKEEDEEKKTNSLDSLEQQSWRIISQDEIAWINGLNERDAITGEYLFSTYDLSHVHPQHHHQLNKQQLDNLDPTSSKDGRKNDVSGVSLCYCHSNTTENERDHANNNMTEDMLADETARLFRRSELSLRELAESQAALVAAASALSLPRQGSEEGSALVSSTAIEGTTTTSTKSPKKKSMSKKLFGSMSKALENLQGTPLNTSTTTSSSMTVLPQDQQLQRGSAQAKTIDKARDLVDDSEGGEGDDNDGGEAGEKKKPINISLYIMGEYDILNDLAIDGARRLSAHAASSDIELLRQNLPCPLPNRWVRCTGWGNCNPSSMYAKDPPVDFDWEKYYDKLRVTTGPGMKREDSTTNIKRGSTKDDNRIVDGAITTANDGVINPQDKLRKATGDALEGITADQNTTTYPTIVSEFDLSQDIYHRIDGRLIKVSRANYVATTKAVTSVVPAGRSGASHFNKPKVAGQQQVSLASTETTSPMSRSTPPLSKRATTGSTTADTSHITSLSHSASTPVINSTSTSSAAKPKKGLVRRMSSIMGKKK